eukprot:TRINITY_DN374_c0_g1_i1.p1 TRINITY_DN374_c0_g1~~TRINITY_DN374_c0_g1_i1.p1  ORF type:complete len:886 (+),score=236.74 TRINITY_DN374_c0_g1_i1:168-2825(+)
MLNFRRDRLLFSLYLDIVRSSGRLFALKEIKGFVDVLKWRVDDEISDSEFSELYQNFFSEKPDDPEAKSLAFNEFIELFNSDIDESQLNLYYAVLTNEHNNQLIDQSVSPARILEIEELFFLLDSAGMISYDELLFLLLSMMDNPDKLADATPMTLLKATQRFLHDISSTIPVCTLRMFKQYFNSKVSKHATKHMFQRVSLYHGMREKVVPTPWVDAVSGSSILSSVQSTLLTEGWQYIDKSLTTFDEQAKSNLDKNFLNFIDSLEINITKDCEADSKQIQPVIHGWLNGIEKIISDVAQAWGTMRDPWVIPNANNNAPIDTIPSFEANIADLIVLGDVESNNEDNDYHNNHNQEMHQQHQPGDDSSSVPHYLRNNYSQPPHKQQQQTVEAAPETIMYSLDLDSNHSSPLSTIIMDDQQQQHQQQQQQRHYSNVHTSSVSSARLAATSTHMMGMGNIEMEMKQMNPIGEVDNETSHQIQQEEQLYNHNHRVLEGINQTSQPSRQHFYPPQTPQSQYQPQTQTFSIINGNTNTNGHEMQANDNWNNSQQQQIVFAAPAAIPWPSPETLAIATEQSKLYRSGVASRDQFVNSSLLAGMLGIGNSGSHYSSGLGAVRDVEIGSVADSVGGSEQSCSVSQINPYLPQYHQRRSRNVYSPIQSNRLTSQDLRPHTPLNVPTQQISLNLGQQQQNRRHTPPSPFYHHHHQQSTPHSFRRTQPRTSPRVIPHNNASFNFRNKKASNHLQNNNNNNGNNNTMMGNNNYETPMMRKNKRKHSTEAVAPPPSQMIETHHRRIATSKKKTIDNKNKIQNTISNVPPTIRNNRKNTKNLKKETDELMSTTARRRITSASRRGVVNKRPKGPSKSKLKRQTSTSSTSKKKPFVASIKL